MAGRLGYARGTETSKQLFIEMFCEGFEIARVGAVVAEQKVQCCFVARLPLIPKTNGLPPVESDDVQVAIDVQLLLNGLETAPESKPPSSEAQIEMSLSEIQSRKLRLEIGNIEPAPEKSHKQVGLREFIMQAILRQSFPAH